MTGWIETLNSTTVLGYKDLCHEFYYLSNVPSVECVLLFAFFAFLAFVTMCGNLLIIISVIYFKQLQTLTNFFILSLAVTDLLVGVFAFPFSMAFSLNSCLQHEHLLCQIRSGVDVSLCTCSTLNMCCISVDRYYVVCHPLTYRSKINGCVVVVMILVSWGISVLTGIGIFVSGLDVFTCKENCSVDVVLSNTFGPVFAFFLPALVMMCIYLKIFLVAQRQTRSIQNATKSGPTASKMERKATKTLAIVLGVYLICWAPFFLCLTSLPFSVYPIPVAILETFNWLILANSLLNPFIYAFFYSWYRSAFKMIITGKIFQGDFTNSKLS